MCIPKVKHSRAHPGGEVVNEPAAVAAYNRSKGGVDLSTHLLNSLNLFRPECKWTMRASVGLLGLTVVNAHLIWEQQWGGEHQSLGDFALDLGHELVRF